MIIKKTTMDKMIVCRYIKMYFYIKYANINNKLKMMWGKIIIDYYNRV